MFSDLWFEHTSFQPPPGPGSTSGHWSFDVVPEWLRMALLLISGWSNVSLTFTIAWHAESFFIWEVPYWFGNR
jgi:hypothetical protein